MGEVRHQGEGPARVDHLTEQPQGRVGVRVGDEPLRPVRQRLGPDPDRLQVIQARVEQRLDVAPQHRLAHDHRIPAGDQDAGHLRVLAQVGDQRADIIGRHLQLGLVHELRPPEAVGAVRVAGLALPGEEQHRLRVLVLQPRQRPAVQAGRVQQQLPGRMRVEPHPDLVRGFAQRRLRRLGLDQAGQPAHVWRGQHVRLGKDEPVDRVVRDRIPVDQVVDHIRIRPERQYGGHGPDGQPFIRRQPGSRREHVQVFRRVRMEPAAG